MIIFADANIFLAALFAEEERGTTAKRFLNSGHSICTSRLVILEIRTVLAKKKQKPTNKVEQAIHNIQSRVDVFIEEMPPLSDVDDIQKQTLLYPLDCIHFTTAEWKDYTFVSFDNELQDNGASDPVEFLSD